MQSLQSKLASDGIFPDDDAFDDAFRKRLFTDFEELESGVGGFDFSRVVWEYFHAQRMHDENRKSACLRYLRGEFANKTEAKQALGFSVSSVIDDDSWYDTIKLFSRLAVSLGFAGFVVFVDECINLYKIPNRISREANYEKLLTIFNDTLQGRAPGLGIVFGGTPQFLEDTRRGLFSYEALRSRLADSRFLSTEYTTMMSPVIRLRRLSDEELLALLFRLTKLFSQQYPLAKALTKEQMEAFLKVSFSRAGAQEMLTPRDLIRDYLTVLHVLLEHPSVTFEEVLAKDKSLNGQDTDAEDDDIEDDLFDFAL